MENHLTLTMMIRQYLNSLINQTSRYELEGVRLLKVYNALEAIQSASDYTAELLEQGHLGIQDVSEDWFQALNRCNEALEGLEFGNTMSETDALVAEMVNASPRQKAELLRDIARIQRQVDEMYASFGYVMN